jgi:hypothetical protein
MSLRPPLPRAKAVAKKASPGTSKAALAHQRKLAGDPKPGAKKHR